MKKQVVVSLREKAGEKVEDYRRRMLEEKGIELSLGYIVSKAVMDARLD
ncbi:MAG: hypothetical protein HUK20_02590 [Fibrobacter sp.]|nr:hypothetical protein [Fibrobacter sp.]